MKKPTLKKIIGYLLFAIPPLFIFFYLIPWIGDILNFILMSIVSILSLVAIVAIMCYGISLAIDGEEK